MEAIFYTRDFTSQIDTTMFQWSVDEFEWSINGGPYLAQITAPINADKWDAATLLRCPVEILDDDGELVWWGYVHEVKLPTDGNISVGVSLDSMYNRVRVTYAYLPAGSSNATQQLNTTYSDAADSQNEFGIKEYSHQMGDGTSTSATSTRDRILAENKYPVPEITPYATDRIELKLKGWWETLDWQHYTNSNTTSVVTTSQISAIVTADGQFLRGTHVFNASGVSTNEFRDGQTSARAQIEDLLSAGTSSGGRLMAIVNQARYLDVIAISTPSNPDFRLRDDGLLEQFAETVLPAGKLYQAIGKWATIKSAPAVVGNYSVIRPFLIESAAWRDGVPTYRPLGQADLLKVNFTGAF